VSLFFLKEYIKYNFGFTFYSVWILVIHYAFSSDESLKRSGNSRDLDLLQKLFEEYEDCTFREIASPQSNEIAHILSKDGIVSRFEDGQTGKR
jgi:hypothetical protein